MTSNSEGEDTLFRGAANPLDVDSQPQTLLYSKEIELKKYNNPLGRDMISCDNNIKFGKSLSVFKVLFMMAITLKSGFGLIKYIDGNISKVTHATTTNSLYTSYRNEGKSYSTKNVDYLFPIVGYNGNNGIGNGYKASIFRYDQSLKEVRQENLYCGTLVVVIM